MSNVADRYSANPVNNSLWGVWDSYHSRFVERPMWSKEAAVKLATTMSASHRKAEARWAIEEQERRMRECEVRAWTLA